METLARAANRGSVSTGYEIDNSLKFEVSNGEGIWRVTDTTSNRRTFTCSMWFKPTEILTTNRFLFGSYLNSTNYTYLRHQSTGKLQFRGHPGSGNKILSSVAVFADTSAWYHLVLAVDTTQSTAANRVKIYINGEQIELTGTYPNQNQDQQVNLINNKTNIGFMQGYYDTLYNFCGYIAESHFVDGTQYAASDFGEYDEDSGIWIPKKADVTYGSQGFYVKFDDASSLGADSSGNTNTLSLQNITSADQATDTPTNNFCTLNPNVNFKYTTNGITEGGTVFGDNTGGGIGGAFGTMAVTKGKWYWEVKLTQQNSHYIGISAVDDGDNVLSSSDPHQINSSFNFNILGARIEYINNGSFTTGSLDAFGDFHTVGDIIGIALNMDDNQISIYGNGTLQSGVANTSLFDAANKMVVPLHGTINDECQYNFGGYSAWTPASAETDENGYGTFEYAPPSGYYALCTKNLAEYG